MNWIKEEYFKYVSNKILVKVDDLTENELKLISFGFELFNEKLDDIKLLNDEIKRLNIELSNLKAMRDDSDYSDYS
jgi:uncharacterized small protein (DUF1192 family)